MNDKNSVNGLLRCLAAIILLGLSFGAVAAAKDIMLVLDNSGSMRKNDPGFLARGAVAAFIEQLDADTRAGVLIFDQGVRVPVPLTTIDDASRARLIESLNGINYRGQLTDSPAAIERAIYELKTNGLADANKVIVFMTDGIVDTGNAEADIEKTKWLRDELAVDAKANGIRVFAIAFTENADFFLIQSLANKTDGEYFRALTPADLGEVFDTVKGRLDTAPPAPVEVIVEPAIEVEAPTPEPSPVAVQLPEPPPVEEQPGPAVTPLPESRLAPQPLAPDTSTAELLASLTEEERLALEDISQQTGIPIEQLVTELVGPEEPGVESPGTVESGGAIVTYPDEEPTVEDERLGAVILGAGVLLLLLLVIFVVWMLRRRSKAAPDTATAAAAGAEAAAPEGAIPEAFINDINHYTDDPALQLAEKPLLVGRVAGTDTEHLDYLVVNKGTVGRRHAIIKYKDYSFWIVDQGSVNGTFVNGERLSGERQLKHGDRIRFHKYEFEYSQPDMDDGFHTVFADPNAAEATIVASAETMAATQAMDVAVQPEPGDDTEEDGDALFGIDQAAADAAVQADAPEAAAFADSEVFDITGETEMSAAADPNDETMEDNETAVFETPPETAAPVAGEFDMQSTVITRRDELQNFADADGAEDEDDEELGVEINLDTVGADDHPSLILNDPPSQAPPEQDFDAEASAFFEDITVGPTPDDEEGPSPDDLFDMGGGDADDSQSELDAKLEQATAILDGGAADGLDEMETVARSDLPTPTPKDDDPYDHTLEQFIETDSFDAPETIPPAHPKPDDKEASGDVTLDAFMSTSMFENVELTNEDATVLPDAVPDRPVDEDNPIVGDTVILPSSPLAQGNKDDEEDDDDESEDPTLLK